jgi:hypothetical protein
MLSGCHYLRWSRQNVMTFNSSEKYELPHLLTRWRSLCEAAEDFFVNDIEEESGRGKANGL